MKVKDTVMHKIEESLPIIHKYCKEHNVTIDEFKTQVKEEKELFKRSEQSIIDILLYLL